ncbi:DDE-type integrase/transposase/recombinase [Cellulomonas sp. PSBB021]|uniref:DDE-type integrase/transposase/recombinase n=1 Tax=Cellulomonas sp. PSBB021 TaxID=2003551 RepID=UPI001E4B31BE|nr:DDE-type integrase/transposase/recombinase [Cellulomonas sp. PSBB021]
MTCRVLKLARQPYYRWLANPVTPAELTQAYRANALFDAHRDDPEFGYRYLAEEAHDAGQVMSTRTAWRICADNQWWSVFGKKKARGKGTKVGPPVHDDLVGRVFTATAANRLWLTDLTEHRTAEGKLYLCAIKDVFSGRIVGYSIDSRMKSRIAVTALENAIARRGDVAGCVVHSDRGSQGGLNRSSQHLVITEVSGGATAAAGGPGVATGDAFTGAADSRSACGAGVLAVDRGGQEFRGGRGRGWCVVAGRVAVVSSRWRDGAVAAGRADRPLPVVPRARGARTSQSARAWCSRDRPRAGA